MSIPTYNARQFLSAALKTLPRGRAWPRTLTGTMARVLSGYMPTPARVTTAAAGMVADVFPSTALSILDAWESTLGLPDPCAGESPTIALRQAQVTARFADSGGSSIPYYINFAATLGYQITVQEFAPARVGVVRIGTPIYGPDWAFAWRVMSPGYTPIDARIGTARIGDPLMSWGNFVLKCEINARSPAHTIVAYAQNGINLLTDFGGDII